MDGVSSADAVAAELYFHPFVLLRTTCNADQINLIYSVRLFVSLDLLTD